MRDNYNNPINRRLAKNLRQIREMRKMSQEELADKASTDRTTLGNIENCRNSPSIDTVGRLADALGIDVIELLREEDPDLSETPRDRLNALLPYIRRYQNLADSFGIADIFQDNGGKLLQTLIITKLKNLPGREGNDAIDDNGNEYELKTVNRNLTSSFSTHHHINPTIIAKYRTVKWLFCIYAGIEIVEMYMVEPGALEPYFTAWEKKWEKSRAESNDNKGKDINNPKLPVNFIRKVGERIYSDAEDGYIAPGPVLAHSPEIFKD